MGSRRLPSASLAKLFIQYLGVGVSFIPWAVAYALLIQAGVTAWPSVLALIPGLFTARLAWNWLARIEVGQESALKSAEVIARVPDGRVPLLEEVLGGVLVEEAVREDRVTLQDSPLILAPAATESRGRHPRESTQRLGTGPVYTRRPA
jgi:hypothetical protein